MPIWSLDCVARYASVLTPPVGLPIAARMICGARPMPEFTAMSNTI